MHEMVFARRLVAEAESHGKVTRMSISVGELAHVPPEELHATLRSIVPYPVDMEIVKAAIECSCGYVGAPKILERGHDIAMYECPLCTQVPPLTSGDEIVLRNVEVE